LKRITWPWPGQETNIVLSGKKNGTCEGFLQKVVTVVTYNDVVVVDDNYDHGDNDDEGFMTQ
jgi:hypothetical protein